MGPRSLRTASSSAALLDAAAGDLREFAADSEVVVIAATRAAADELTRAAASPALHGVHRFTLARLAAGLAAPPMAARGMAPLSALGAEALAARAVHTLKQDRKLEYFHPVADTPGFARALSRTIGELRLERVKPDQLARTGAPGADLAALRAAYEDELEARSLADLAAIFDLGMEGEHAYAGLPVILLDPRVETAAAREFLGVFIASAPRVAAFALDRDVRSIAALQAVLGWQAGRMEDRAEGTLGRIRIGLFSSTRLPGGTDGSFDFFSAPGEGLECVEIARRILALGVPFDDVAILLRDADRYQPAAEEALRRAGIPAYFSRGTVRPDPAGRAFLALLACAAEGCSATRFAEYLSLGQVPKPGAGGEAPFAPAEDELLAALTAAEPAAEETPDEPSLNTPFGWERLLVDAAVIGGRDRWSRRLRGLEAEFRLQLAEPGVDDDQRDRVSRQLHRLGRLERFALPLIDALASLPVSTAWGDWIDALSDLAIQALRVPDGVLAVLNELQPMAEAGPAGFEEVTQVLTERLRFLRREPPPRRYGRVFVGSIEEARARSFRVVFVPGLAEGIFPRRPAEDPLLLDVYRRELSGGPEASPHPLPDGRGSESGVEPSREGGRAVRFEPGLTTREDRAANERLLLHIALAAAREKLIVSYPRLDAGASRARVPSFYAMETVTAAEGELPDLRAFAQRAAAGCPARLGWPAPRDTASAIDDTEYDLVRLEHPAAGSAAYLKKVNPHLRRSLNARWMRWTRDKWSASDGLLRATPALAAHRLAARAYSPSALQQFAVCPYRFLLSAIHQLREREDRVRIEQLDPLTRGALFHAVQFEFYREMSQAELPDDQVGHTVAVLDLLDAVLHRVAARYEEELAPAIPRVWQSEIEDLRRDLRGWLQHADRNWKPAHFEFAFGYSPRGEHDAASVTEEAVIEGGYRVRGSIDVVEEHADTNRLRVTDHKTGKPPDPMPVRLGGGQALQPLLYALAAEQLLGRPVESGRLFYCTERGGYASCDIPLNEDSRKTLVWALSAIDRAIAQPFLPAAPAAGACERCEFRPACGPYEEIRVARKPKQALAQLTYLRSVE